MSTLSIDAKGVVSRHPVLPIGPREVDVFVRRLLHALSLEGQGLSIAVVDDAHMEMLNERFLGLVGPTNVLSFEVQDDAGGLGEVILNADAVLREARLYGQNPVEHMGRLLAHGVLHLAGLEHGPEMDSAVEAVLGDLPAHGF